MKEEANIEHPKSTTEHRSGRYGAILIRDLSISFPANAPASRSASSKMSAPKFRQGEFVCIVGPSGCGKSTLLNIVAGFLGSRAAERSWSKDSQSTARTARIFIFQENGVFPWLTVRENIAFGVRAEETRDEIVARYTEMVGLTGFENAYPRELSGGMRQRVEIARALAASPDIIYMDEPFGALDFITRMKMRADLVRIWQSEKKTILFVTHDIEEAVQLADRVLIMSNRPATIQHIVEIDLPRPRDLDSPGYLQKRDQIFRVMGMSLRVGETAA